MQSLLITNLIIFAVFLPGIEPVAFYVAIKCVTAQPPRPHGYELPVFDELCKIADDELFGRAT